jgi:GGDEF domain-containing protein
MIIFVIGFAIFFNLERLDFGEQNLIDISSFIYILGVAAIISAMAVPALQHSNLPQFIIFWLLIYLVGKVLVFIFSGRPVFGGVYTYLSITEVTLFLILIRITHWLTVAMNHFETAIENLAFSNADHRLRPLDEAAEDIQIEMFRSRHNHHPLSIAIVEPDPLSAQEALNALLNEVRQVIMNKYAINRMTSTLSKYLRRTDVLLGQPGHSRFIILCPDTSARDLNLLVEYIQLVSQEQLGITVNCGIATFPGDALTFEELVHKAETNLQTLNGHKNVATVTG